MFEEAFIVGMRRSTARGIWKDPRAGRENSRWNMASRLNQANGSGMGGSKKGREERETDKRTKRTKSEPSECGGKMAGFYRNQKPGEGKGSQWLKGLGWGWSEKNRMQPQVLKEPGGLHEL